jgi:two-component system chemotaxis sensor kinase CheA
MHIPASEIARGAHGASVVYGGKAVPFVALSTMLTGTRPPVRRSWPAVIVAGASEMVAIGVEQLPGAARVVVRPLPELAPASAIVAGAWLDAGGNPQLVLDPDGLVALAGRGDTVDAELAASARPVLVIDDSLTTRMLEQSILVSAGYEVDVATSGEQGLEKARRKRYALFLVDVEMPGISGFDFVERIRADPELHDIPSILVTSRSAPEDRQRGRDAGARGYIVKSEFDQAALLAMIKPLIGH